MEGVDLFPKLIIHLLHTDRPDLISELADECNISRRKLKQLEIFKTAPFYNKEIFTNTYHIYTT